MSRAHIAPRPEAVGPGQVIAFVVILLLALPFLPLVLLVVSLVRLRDWFTGRSVAPVHPPTRVMPTDLVVPDSLMDLAESLRSVPPSRWLHEPSHTDRAAGAAIRFPTVRKEG